MSAEGRYLRKMCAYITEGETEQQQHERAMSTAPRSHAKNASANQLSALNQVTSSEADGHQDTPVHFGESLVGPRTATTTAATAAAATTAAAGAAAKTEKLVTGSRTLHTTPVLPFDR